MKNHRGRYYRVENARVYTLPRTLPPILVAGGGPRSAELAGRIGDFISTSPKREVIDKFQTAGGQGKPRYGELTVCWADDEAQARRTAREVWPISALASPLAWELALPSHLEAATRPLTEAHVAEDIVCGPDAERHLRAIKQYADAGYDHVFVHQVGPDQEGFFRFYEREVLPKLRSLPAAA